MQPDDRAPEEFLKIPSPADFHVHLRQDELQKLVVPHVAQGGVKLAYVMPNLVPPLTDPAKAATYLKELQALDPATEYLMTMYLSSTLTPDMIRIAFSIGIRGVKSYPRGVTTNSDGGVGMEGYAVYDEVFGAMEEVGMVLNLHGEVPALPGSDDGTCVLNAEERFLPHLHEIHRKFPKLKIVLEHVTTAAAVAAVKEIDSPNVAATITPHHLSLTIDDVVSSSLSFCKPVAKYPSDRAALRNVIEEANPRFFLGSDSAPHPSKSKLPTIKAIPSAQDASKSDLILPSPCAAGIYTSPILIPLCATLFESLDLSLDLLPGFVSTFGRTFYGHPAQPGDEVTLRRVPQGVPVPTGYQYVFGGTPEWVVPFQAGKKLKWEIVSP